MQALLFVIYVPEKYLMKLDYSFCIVRVCREPQQVYKYIGFFKSFFYCIILKVLFQQDK